MYGQGGYDPWGIYDMPIWWRRFTHKKIEEHYQKQKEAHDKQQNTLDINKPTKISKPDINPTYTTQGTKK